MYNLAVYIYIYIYTHESPEVFFHKSTKTNLKNHHLVWEFSYLTLEVLSGSYMCEHVYSFNQTA